GYGAVQRIELAPEALVLRLALTNESAHPMPAGLGWHPYFPRTAAATLTARVTGMWLTDAETLPRAYGAPGGDQDPGQGLAVDRVSLDNVFVGWDGRAEIAWPEKRARLVMTGSPRLGRLGGDTPPRPGPFWP